MPGLGGEDISPRLQGALSALRSHVGLQRTLARIFTSLLPNSAPGSGQLADVLTTAAHLLPYLPGFAKRY